MCKSANTNTTNPFCEVLSGRICLVNGHRCLGQGVCAWPEVCVCFLSLMAPQHSATTQPELIDSQWARVEAHPLLYCGTETVDEGKNLLVKCKTSHNTVFRLHYDQPRWFLYSFFLCFSFYPFIISPLPLILPSKAVF